MSNLIARLDALERFRQEGDNLPVVIDLEDDPGLTAEMPPPSDEQLDDLAREMRRLKLGHVGLWRGSVVESLVEIQDRPWLRDQPLMTTRRRVV